MTEEADALEDARSILRLSEEVGEAVDRVLPDLRTEGARTALKGFLFMSDFLGKGARAILEKFGEEP